MNSLIFINFLGFELLFYLDDYPKLFKKVMYKILCNIHHFVHSHCENVPCHYVLRHRFKVKLILFFPFITVLSLVQTNYGDIEFGFFPNVAPKTVEHIFKLVRLGCYNTNHFFRVVFLLIHFFM